MSESGPDGSPNVLPHSPFVPYDPGVSLYVGNTFPHAVPYEHTDWREETMAWKTSAYLNGNLNPSPTYCVSGPDALKFFSDTCVNGFSNFPINSSKHAIMCNDRGQVMMDGVVVRLAEDDFITYWLAPYLTYALQKGKYDAIGEDLTGKVYLFQLAGPRSLEILEKATQDDLHNVRFMGAKSTSIGAMQFNVLRMGMAGTLAHELHGWIEDAKPVYNALMKAGAEFGIMRLGQFAYMMNHTEDGFPQAYYHFPYPWAEDAGFATWLGGKTDMFWSPLRGSMGTDIKQRYRTLVELGWEKMARFDHNFVGRSAIEREITNPKRHMVTLVWNTDDIIDIQASQYRLGRPYTPMDSAGHFVGRGLFADQVLKNGKLVGISSGRAYSYNYRVMLSLCSLDVDHTALGNEVIVLWGDPGTRQKEIRAIVSRFPYLNEGRNQTVDVSQIPRISEG
jgi:glycine cleavage system aminomethyltransferase T